MRKLIFPVLAFFLVFGTAAAAEVKTNVDGSVRWGGPAVQPVDSLSDDKDHPKPFNPGGPMHPATTTMEHPGMWHGSSTPGMWHGSSTMAVKGPAVPGTITAISSNSFTMTAPFGKNHATTTLTVNVSSSTMYMHASSTESFSDLTVGSHVVVFGKISTSTASVTAERILVTGDMPEKAKGGLGGFIGHLKDLLTGDHASTTEAMIEAHASTTMPANMGVVQKILHALFGWL